jgi:spore coat protein I
MKEMLNESMDYLKELAIKVLVEYDILPVDIFIIQSGGIKAVWKIKTKDKILCLKRLRQTYDKVLFSANAQVYIASQNGNVPSVILDKKGEPVALYNHQLFVLYEWLEGENLYFNNNADLEAAIKGLAAFHIASKGYRPPKNSRESSKFGQSPELYTSMKNRFEEWKYQAYSIDPNDSHASYLGCVDSMIDLANLAIELLEKSNYKELVTPDSNLKVLCHQDFGEGNVITTPNGVIVLDLDSVTFDFLVRDLRKIIGKLSEEEGKLDLNIMDHVMSWYSSVNPISSEEKKFLYIDLLFPHWFHGLVKNQYLKNKLLSPAEITEIAEFERSKLPILMKLLE